MSRIDAGRVEIERVALLEAVDEVRGRRERRGLRQSHASRLRARPRAHRPGTAAAGCSRSGEPIAKAACGAVIAPWYLVFHHVALKRRPGSAAGSMSMPTEYVSPSCATRSLLPPARNMPGHARSIDEAGRRRGRASRQADRARIGVRNREVRIHAGGGRSEQAAERRLRGHAVRVAAAGQRRRRERFSVVGADAQRRRRSSSSTRTSDWSCRPKSL